MQNVRGSRIEDPFVVNELLIFGTGSATELIVFGIPMNSVGLNDGSDPWLVLRIQ